MGSEGNYGVITEAVIRVRPLPEVRIFDSIIFYDWESGIKFMYDVSKTNSWPASCRLVDNIQFQFGATLKPGSHNAWEKFVESAKKFFVLNVKGYEKDKLVACTLLFEGNKHKCEKDHKVIMDLAKKYQGMRGGAENGMRGYVLTFLIAYIRDFSQNHYVAAESFETSCRWSNVSQLCKRVRTRIFYESTKKGFP